MRFIRDSFNRGFHRLTGAGRHLFGGAFGDVQDVPLLEPDEHSVSGPAGRLRILRWRKGDRPLILVHGVNSNAWMWGRIAALMPDGWDLITLNQRGHGGSEAPTGGYDLDDTSADLDALAAHFGLEDFDLCGTSWGGKVAFHYAATRPERVRKLVLADPVLPGGFNPVLRYLPMLPDAAFAPERTCYSDQAAWEKARSEVLYLRTDLEHDRRIWAAGFRREGGRYLPRLSDAAFEFIRQVVLLRDDSHLIPRVRCRTLLMLPTYTVSFLPWELRPLQGLDLRTVRISGDHGFIHTNPKDTLENLLWFLS